MLRLVLCRHGQSEADLEPRRIEGNADFPLTDLGCRQGDALAGAVAARYRPDRLISSPLLRARSTAEQIGAATGLPVEIEPALAEGSNGLLAGLTQAEADRLYPVRHPVPIHHRPPEGESYLDHYSRVAHWWCSLYSDETLDQKCFCIVTHGGTLKCLMAIALGLPPTAPVTFASADTGLHELRIQPGGRVVVARWNDVSHLEACK